MALHRCRRFPIQVSGTLAASTQSLKLSTCIPTLCSGDRAVVPWTRSLVHRYSTYSSRRGLSTTASNRDGISTFRDVANLRLWRKALLMGGQTLGFVPTMGALHAGHLRLAKEAAAENDNVIVSIYVNPTQFGVNEDLDKYPRTFDSDIAQLSALNEQLRSEKIQGRVTAVFAPTSKVIYPVLPPTSEIDGNGSFVLINPIGQLLEGASRPVFFRGVATVCMKLFNIVRPERVYFGQKDVQQTIVIKRLVEDFHHDIHVRVVTTEREADGLAMSSRNVFLGQRRRAVAPVLSRALAIAASQIRDHGETERGAVLKPAYDFLDKQLAQQMAQGPSKRALFILDYISLAHPDSMEEVEQFDASKGAILSGALKMLPVEQLQTGEEEGHNGGSHQPIRLIDNIIIEANGKHK